MSSSVDQSSNTLSRVADARLQEHSDALLREHPDALVCAIADSGLILSMPKSVPLWGQAALEGRTVFDGVVAADRKAVVGAWWDVKREGAGAGRVRLLAMPSRWTTLHFFDLREDHGIFLGVLIPGEEAANDDTVTAEPEIATATPRFSTLIEDENGTILEPDEAFTQMFGYTAEELIGKRVLNQIHPDDQARAVESWVTMLSTQRAQQTRCRRRRKDGSWMWIDTTLHNFLNHPDRNHVLVEILDVSPEMAALQELERRATIDALTDCYTRQSILGELELALRQGDSAHTTATHTAVIYLDLDGFKAVNDTLGHAAGDELLTQVAERLRVASRDGDDIGRLGGDEFLVLLRDIPTTDVALRAAQRMCEAIGGNNFELSSGTTTLRLSAGVAIADSHADTCDELVQRADAAMYRSKDQGQGTPVLA
jgi:diguanylate cyclase (GGDEF)-like protein/PAS domain S-box-containing protein